MTGARAIPGTSLVMPLFALEQARRELGSASSRLASVQTFLRGFETALDMAGGIAGDPFDGISGDVASSLSSISKALETLNEAETRIHDADGGDVHGH